MDNFGRSLDVGESLNRDINNQLKKEQEKNKIPDVVVEDGSPVAEEEIPEIKEPVDKPKNEGKTMAKKKSKSSAKKAAKKKEEDDDDFDFDDDDEGGIGIYVFWAIILIIALLLAMWIFTDWQMCIQF